MKRCISLIISCSLALGGIALAQQPDESPAKGAKGKKEAAEKTRGPEARGGVNAARPEAAAGKQRAGSMTTTAPAQGKMRRPETPGKAEKSEKAGAAGEATTTASAAPEKGQARRGKKDMNKAAEANAKASPGAGAAAETGAAATTTKKGGATSTTSASAAPSGATATTTGGATAGAGAAAGAKKVAPQKVQEVKAQTAQIKQQHATFKAQPKPEQVPTVTYNQNYRIQNAETWSAPQYEVFRTYRPEWHDSGWYRSHYSRVELIGGGYYFWNNGYWYPAWGYDPSAQYYAYDAPIYVGQRAEPPDRVIADVQAELQMMGYYRGEVDGLLGPLTREALMAYQQDQGLTQTAMIDQPTLDSLGMG